MRYALQDKDAPLAGLTLDITCAQPTIRGTAVGYACSSSVTYCPFSGVAINTNLSGQANTLAVCGLNGADCAEDIFEKFVAGTQTDKLADAMATTNFGGAAVAAIATP
jgi:hypothetical protein